MVSRAPINMWRQLGAVPYREVLDTPGIARAHDMQRLVSYGLGIAVALVATMPAWRASLVLGIAIGMFAAALFRLGTKRNASPYPVAHIDQLFTGIAIALATGSPVITIGVVVFISSAVAASFKATPRLAVWLSLITASPGVVLSFFIKTDQSGGATDVAAIIVLIVLLLALAAFILVFFALQTGQLRRQLGYQQDQLNAVLAVTPIVLAAVSKPGVLTILAGDLPEWTSMSEHPLPDSSPIVSLIADSIASGQRATADIEVEAKTFSVTCDPGKEGDALLTVYDVSDQTEARKRLEDVVRAKDQFIAAVSHELRTPLASVLGFSELVQEQMDPSDTAHPMMTEVTDQSAEMAAIIDDLLVAARASFESVPLTPRQISLATECETVIDSIGSRLNITPENNLAQVDAFADPIRVRQIIRNLLTNADRYGGDRVIIETASNGESSLVKVCDSGDPLPRERHEQIFQPYESSGPVRGQPAAIGLGLAVSRTLAEMMGGGIKYSHDGEWSIFKLSLPATAPSDKEPTLDSDES